MTTSAPQTKVPTKRRVSKKIKVEEVAAPEVPVPAPVVEPAPLEPEPVVVHAEEKVQAADDEEVKTPKKKKLAELKFSEQVDKLHNSFISHFEEYKAADPSTAKFLKTYERELRKVKQQAEKLTIPKPRRKSDPSRQLSGFLKPVAISPSMAKFAGWDASETKSRTDVTTFLCQYIKQNKLQDAADGRVIHADPPLKTLLNYNEESDGVLTFASMQKMLKPHFIKV